jgi:hypothetical protein
MRRLCTRSVFPLLRLAPAAAVGLALASAAVASSAAPVQDAPQASERRAMRLAEQALADDSLDALGAWIRLGEGTLFRATIGSLDGGLADGDSRFPAGALSEVLLAAAVTEAAAAHGQSLTAALEPLHPELPWPLEGLSLHALLAHCTGLATVDPSARAEPAAWPVDAGVPREDDGDDGDGDGDDGEQAAPAPQAPLWWQHVSQAPRDALPGTCFGWSDANLLLAHAWFEATTGSDLVGYLESSLAPRLGWDTRRVLAAPDADWTPVRPDLSGPGRALGALPPALGAGRLRLTLAELGGFADALFGGGLLGEEGTRALTADTRLDSGERTGHGYGVEHLRLGDYRGIGFGGRAGHGLVRVSHYPEVDATVVLLGVGAARSLEELERSLLRVLLDLPLDEPAGLPLSAEERTRYAGTYQIGCNQLVVLADGEGIALLAGDERLPLEFLGAHTFVARGGDVRLEFRLPDSGPASEFLLIWSGSQSIARRFGNGEGDRRDGTPRAPLRGDGCPPPVLQPEPRGGQPGIARVS